MQGELFPWPGPSPSPPRKPKPGITYAPCQLRRRTLCQDCTALIHKYGQQGAPYPKVVRWKRIDGLDVRFLCDDHRRERQESE